MVAGQLLAYVVQVAPGGDHPRVLLHSRLLTGDGVIHGLFGVGDRGLGDG